MTEHDHASAPITFAIITCSDTRGMKQDTAGAAAFRGVPQLPQNFASATFSVAQLGHSMAVLHFSCPGQALRMD